MTGNVAILPILAAFVTALASFVFWKPSRARHLAVIASAAVQLVISILILIRCVEGRIFVMNAGGWTAPYGIVLAIDSLSAIMVCLTCLMGLSSLAFGYFESRSHLEHPLRLPLIEFVIAGLQLCFITGDLFNLFVGFEVMLISSYVLLTLESNDQNIRQAIPYLLINLFGSFMFLVAIALIYMTLGTLNFADIASRVNMVADDVRFVPLSLVFIIVFGLKAGVFPFHYWIPSTYPALPGSIAALFAGILGKVGLYAMIRVFVTLMPPDSELVVQSLRWLAITTMIFGVLVAVSRTEVSRILAYHSISQIGYMLLCLSFFTPGSLAACIFFMIHHSIVKSSLFLIGGAVQSARGHDRVVDGGLVATAPLLSVCFFMQGMSLAGIPPLSGFWAKYFLLKEGLEGGHFWGVGAALIVSLFTLLSMIKIWNAVFWTPTADPPSIGARTRGMARSVTAMTAALMLMSLGAETVYSTASAAAAQAFDRAKYVQKVFESPGKPAR